MATTPPTMMSFGQRLGDFMILETALVSIIAVLTFLLFAFINALWQRFSSQARPKVKANEKNQNPDPNSDTSPPPPRDKRWRFLSSTSDYYILGLLTFDVILCLGQILDARWIGIGMVVSGSYCMAQGILQQTGDVGVALMSLAIACHTFAVLFFRWQPPKTKLFPLGVIAFISLFLLLATLVPALTRPDFWDVAGDWCWISPKYSRLQVGLEYMIFWITALVSFALYVPLFLCLRGNILVDFTSDETWGKGRMRLSWNWIKRADAWNTFDDKEKKGKESQMAVARRMLAFPVAYTFIILPSSIFRLMQDKDHTKIPSTAITFAGIVYAFSGLVNVTLYLITRPSVFEFLGRVVCGRRPSADVAEEHHKVPRLGLVASDSASTLEKGHSEAGPPYREASGSGCGRESIEQQQAGLRDDDAVSERVPSEFSLRQSSEYGGH